MLVPQPELPFVALQVVLVPLVPEHNLFVAWAIAN
jgi:hypothetical protein